MALAIGCRRVSTLTCRRVIPHNRQTVFRKVKALLLVLALLAVTVAPTAAACLEGTGADADGCCSKSERCAAPVLSAPCCDCTSSASSTAPPVPAVAPGPAPVLAPFHHVQAPAHSGPVSLAARDAFAATLLGISHDPPWLLFASLLI